MLWIALHLPLLSLESFAATLPAKRGEPPIALMDAQRIVSANAAAQALGVKPGLKRATALALAPQLVLGRADAARDAQAIESVAHAALVFTPSVTCLLHAAPVWLLGAGREHWDALQGMGLRTCADLRRLPRSGIGQRFGEALLDELDRALGERPDPRNWVTLPAAFGSRLELF